MSSKVFKYILSFQADAEKFGKEIGGVKGMLKGAAVAAGALFAADKIMDAAKAVGDYAVEISKVRAEVEKFTGLTGAQGDIMAGGAEAIKQAYGEEVSEVIKASNVLMRQFGETSQSSFDLLNAGLAGTANANGDFLHQIQEYSTHFREAGLGAEEMYAIIEHGSKTGVFDDKAADAIKEGSIRLREMTTATQDALNAIGLSSTQIQADISSGNRSMFEVMQLVSSQLQQLPEQSSEVGTALADIFGGPGEDGIEFIRTLADIDTSMEGIEAGLTDAQKAQKEWVDELKEFHTYGSIVFGDMQEKVLSVKTTMLSWLNEVTKAFVGPNEALKQEREEIQLAVISATSYAEGTNKRKEALNQLKELYPDYFGNLDSEKTKNEDLVAVLDKVNEAYANKIVLREYEDQLGSIAKEEEKLENTRVSSIKLLNSFREQYNYNVSSLDELITKTKEFVSYQNSGEAGTKVAKGYIQGLEEAVEFLDTYEDKLADITSEKTSVENAKNSILSLLGINEDNIEETGNSAGESFAKGFKQGYQGNASIETPELMKPSVGGSQLSVGLSEEELAAFDEAKTQLADMNSFIDQNIASVNSMTDSWESYAEVMNRVAAERETLQGGLSQLDQAGLQLTETFMNLAKSGEVNMENLGEAVYSVVTDSIRAYIAEGVAGAVKNALVGVPFPFNFAAGAAAAVTATALFNSIIPKFADGGIAYGPTVGMIGEYPGASSNPEVIAPLDKLQGIMSSSGSGSSRTIIPTTRIRKGDIYISYKEAEKEIEART